ncbi:MAG: fibronectin type III domain-containing protein [Janthinobacterium lividum]
MKQNFIQPTLSAGLAGIAGSLATLLVAAGLATAPLGARAQVVLTSAAPKTENFDGMGTSAAAQVPTGFVIATGKTGITYSTATPNTTATTRAGGTAGTGALVSNSGGGAYNFANGVTATATDRALGFLTSGSYAVPAHLLLAVQNNTGATITDLALSYDIEKYRTGSNAFEWQFWTSSDGSAWTQLPAPLTQLYAADAANAVVNPATTITKSTTLTGLNLAAGATTYLRWTYTGSASANGQALGLDNLVLTPTLAGGTTPTPTASISTGTISPTAYCVTGAAGSAISVPFTTTGTLAGTYSVQLSDASGVFPASATAGIIGSGSASPLAATIPAGTASGTGYRVRVLNSNPATTGTDNGSNLAVSQAPTSNPVTVAPAAAQTVPTTGTGASLVASTSATSTFAWQYGTSAGGPYSALAGASGATYQVRGADLPGAGTYYVVAQATTTTSCGSLTTTSAPVTVTVTAPAPTPALSVSVASLPAFSNVAVGAASLLQGFTVGGAALTGPLTITPPAGFEIRTGATAFACCAIVLTPVNGTVPTTTIEVRFVPTASQAYAASISVTTPGQPEQAVAVAGTGIDAVYPATLRTAALADLTPTTATSGGSVATDGGSPVTARGVVWSKTANPVLGTSQTADGAGPGYFSSALTGLLPGTTYFVRAYATNGLGTSYGDELTFATVAVPLADEPASPATLSASQVTSTSLVLNLGGGPSQKYLVLARLGSPVDATPTDATTYTADAAFGKGQVLSPGTYVVYNGTGNQVTVTGLRPNTPYNFAVFAFNDNNTPYAENYLTASPGTLAQATLALPAALLLEENFEYPVGAKLTDNNWTAHSGAGTKPVAVVAPGLSYAGYGPSSGNAAALVASGEDVNRPFAPVYARTPVYASFLVKVNSVTTTGDYFFNLGPQPIGSTYRARVFVRRDASGKLQFGISGGTGTASYSPASYDLGATVLVVVKHTFDEAGNSSQLFLNPTTDTEPATADATQTETGTTPAAPNDNIGSVALRQGTTSPNLVMDGLRVGNSFRVVKTGLTCLPPVPAFTAAPVCAGAPTTFVDASTTVEANATYAWDVNGDGTVDFTTAGNLSYTYPTAGVYTARLTITQGTCSDTYSQQVTVRALPTATLSGTATVCAGTASPLTVHLTGQAPWTVSYAAAGGPATTLPVTAADVDASGNYTFAVQPAATTTYSLTAVTDANCTGASPTGTATVTVNTPPTLTVPTLATIPAPADQCGATVAFAATAGGAPAPTVTYTLSSGATITSPYFFPVGTTPVTATATNGCGTLAKTFTVTVIDQTAPTVLTQTLTVALQNGTATITAAQVNNGSTDACGIAALALSQTTFSCDNIGANTVTLTVTDSHGNVATQTATVTVTGTVPTPTIAVKPSSNVYTGGNAAALYLGYGPQSVTLTATGGTSYQWYPAAGLSTSTGATTTFTATKPGRYTYLLTATSASGCQASTSITLTVTDVRCGNKNDKVTVCHNGNALCIADNAVPAHLNHGDQLGACATSTAAASSANAQTAAETTLDLTPMFEAAPNPFVTQTELHFRAATTGPAQLLLYNGLGQVVQTLYHGTAEAGRDYRFTVQAGNLGTGLYIGHLAVDGKVQTVRLVLAR